jgi:hypothetical protein
MGDDDYETRRREPGYRTMMVLRGSFIAWGVLGFIYLIVDGTIFSELLWIGGMGFIAGLVIWKDY